ncbi:MAG: hypothetical protein ND807_18030 [Vicinamibacterales bacterium]|nr:hypothetical protein [Vicinamibacterales bacterium]
MLRSRPFSPMPTADATKAIVLATLDAVRTALRAEPGNVQLGQALDQCDRLQLAISQFHAEGLRFAAFTLLRMTRPPTTTFGGPVQSAAQDLKAALDTAGYPH